MKSALSIIGLILLCCPICKGGTAVDDVDPALIGKWVQEEYKVDLDVHPIEAITYIEQYIAVDYDPIILEIKPDGSATVKSDGDKKGYPLKITTDGEHLYVSAEGKSVVMNYRVNKGELEIVEDVKSYITKSLVYIFRDRTIPANLKIDSAKRIALFRAI